MSIIKYKPSREKLLEFFLAQCRLLGYPECCGKAYHEIDKPENAPEPQRSIYLKFGWFFACPQHAKEINENFKAIDEIISLDKRHESMPAFKETCNQKDLDEIHRKTVEVLLAEDPAKWSWLNLL